MIILVAKRIKFTKLNHTSYCKPINIGGYLIWQILPSGHIDYYLIWLTLVMFSMSLITETYVGGYLMWTFLGPSQISQLKSPPNINRFTVVYRFLL